ncbi:MAG: hypothetical protein MI866_20660 [Bacteroidales bacterium]|nr:hypothetical protein [Bacteroidales bacterium]
MAFYSEIVEAYDAIFPLNETQLFFVEEACCGSLASKVFWILVVEQVPYLSPWHAEVRE